MLVEIRKLNQTKFDLKHTNLELVLKTSSDNNKMPVNVIYIQAKPRTSIRPSFLWKGKEESCLLDANFDLALGDAL